MCNLVHRSVIWSPHCAFCIYCNLKHTSIQMGETDPGKQIHCILCLIPSTHTHGNMFGACFYGSFSCLTSHSALGTNLVLLTRNTEVTVKPCKLWCQLLTFFKLWSKWHQFIAHIRQEKKTSSSKKTIIYHVTCNQEFCHLFCDVHSKCSQVFQ